MIKAIMLILLYILYSCSQIEMDEVIDDRLPKGYNRIPNYKPQI